MHHLAVFHFTLAKSLPRRSCLARVRVLPSPTRRPAFMISLVHVLNYRMCITRGPSIWQQASRRRSYPMLGNGAIDD